MRIYTPIINGIEGKPFEDMKEVVREIMRVTGKEEEMREKFQEDYEVVFINGTALIFGAFHTNGILKVNEGLSIKIETLVS